MRAAWAVKTRSPVNRVLKFSSPPHQETTGVIVCYCSNIARFDTQFCHLYGPAHPITTGVSLMILKSGGIAAAIAAALFSVASFPALAQDDAALCGTDRKIDIAEMT